MIVPSLHLDTSGTKFGITHLKSAPAQEGVPNYKGLGVEESVIKFIRAKAADDCGPLGARILTRAAQHLEDLFEAELFGPRPHLQTEQHAIAYIKGLGLELQKASEALFQAAERFKAAGKVTHANETYKAHLYFRDKAKEILG